MEILGHSSPVLSLARYGHLLDGATDALATRVGDRLFGEDDGPTNVVQLGGAS